PEATWRGATAPPRNPRSPGTSGSTHGDRDETSPASIATGIAIQRAPEPMIASGFTTLPGSSRVVRERVLGERREDRGPVDRSDDARGDTPLLVEHERGRRRGDRRDLRERELGLGGVDVDQTGVCNVVLLGETDGSV